MEGARASLSPRTAGWVICVALIYVGGCHLIFPFDLAPAQQDASAPDQRAADSAAPSGDAPAPLDTAVDQSQPTLDGGSIPIDAPLPGTQWMKLSYAPPLPWPSSKQPSIYASGSSEIYVAVGDALYECQDMGMTLSCLKVLLPTNLSPGFTLRDIGGVGSAVHVVGGPGIFLSKQSGWQNLYTEAALDFHSVWCNGSAQCYLGAERLVAPYGAVSVSYKGGFSAEKNNSTIPRYHGTWHGPVSYRFLVGPSCQIDQYTGTSWTSGTPPGCTADLHSVWGGSPSDVHAVGAGGVRLRYAGNTWTVVTPPAASAPALRAVWGFTTTSVYAVGDGGQVWWFDGGSWSQPPQANSLTTQHLYDLWGFVANGKRSVYVIGAAGTTLRFKE